NVYVLKRKLREDESFRHHKSKFGQGLLRSNHEFMKLVHETKDYLQNVQYPELIAQGQKDGLVPFKTVYALEDEIGSEEKEVVFFEESDHLICLGDNRDILVQMIYDFLMDHEEEAME